MRGADAADPTPVNLQLSEPRRPALRRKPAPARRRSMPSPTRPAGAGQRAAAQRQGAVVQQPARPRRGAGHRPIAAEPAVAVIKHNNPCGAATADAGRGGRKAWDGDPLSAFGSVLGFNEPVDAATAEFLAEPGRLSRRSSRPTSRPRRSRFSRPSPSGSDNVRLLARRRDRARPRRGPVAADRRRHARAGRRRAAR